MKVPRTPTGRTVYENRREDGVPDEFVRWLAQAEDEARAMALDEVLAEFGPEAVEDHDHARWTYAGIADVVAGLKADR